jgi:hypothetical protein
MPVLTSAVLPAGTTIDTAPLNAAFLAHANEINRAVGFLPTGAAVGPATNANTASSLVQRDNLGGTQLTYAAITPGGAGQFGISIGALTGYTGEFINGTVNGVQVWGIDHAGAASFSSLTVGTGTVTANTFVGALSGHAASAGNADSLTAPISFANAISDYKLGTSNAANTVSIAAGGAYPDSNGNQVGPLGAQSITLPTQPTGTHTQYVGISLAPGSGLPIATPAGNDTPLSSLVIPPVNRALGVVFQRGQTTLPGGVIAAGDIVSFLPGGGAGGGGGGGTGGAPVDARYIVAALNGTLTNELTLDTALKGGTELGNLVPSLRPAALQASLDDGMKSVVTSNIMQSLQAGSSGTLTITVLSGPIFISSNGVWNLITTAITTQNAASGANSYKLIATLQPTGSAPLLRLSTGSPGTNEVVLCNVYYDGSTWQLDGGDGVDWSPSFPSVYAAGFKKWGFNERTTAVTTINSAAYVQVPQAPASQITRYFATPMRFRVDWNAVLTAASANTRYTIDIRVDGVNVPDELVFDQAAAGQINGVSMWTEASNPYAIGPHTFEVYARAFNNSTFAAQSVTLNPMNFIGTFFR